ncbi:MAG: hypothetical protein AB8B92_01080 [Gammaproteobacteria bacterium]
MLFKRKKQTVTPTPKIEDPYHSNRRILDIDRRSFGPATIFPYINSQKKIIQQDRRSRPERRINNIVVVESSIKFDMETLTL